MIHNWLAELIKKYSFINRYEQLGVNLIFYLEDSCSIKSFKVNKYRTTKKLLNSKIDKIKKQIGYNHETADWKRQNEN